MLLKLVFIITLVLIPMIEFRTEDQMKVRPHKDYKDVMCSYPKITSMTKLRDNKYFVSSNGQKFWIISDSEEATDKNSRDLNNITSDWSKIDASLYFSLKVECGHQYRDRLVLVNYNEKSQKNEVIVGSLVDWKWDVIDWSEINVFKLAAERIDWKRSIDDIAIIDETLFIFQSGTQIRIDCLFKSEKWNYEISGNYKEVPISGPIDAAYCDDKYKDIYPIYVMRENSYYICYVQNNNKEFPTCDDPIPLNENSMTPKPSCYVKTDPNKDLRNSLFVQMIYLFLLMVVLIIFSVMYLWDLWVNSSDETPNKSSVPVKGSAKPSEKGQNKQQKSEIINPQKKSSPKIVEK